MNKRNIGLGVFGLIGIAYVVSNGMLLSDYMKKRKHKNAETFDAELKRDSCCCGATIENPCLCMKEGVMNCSSVEPKCPCYSAKDAESFEAFDKDGNVIMDEAYYNWSQPCDMCDGGTLTQEGDENDLWVIISCDSCGFSQDIKMKEAESFEAPGEMEEEDFIPMDITQCHVCARPYEYSRIARALVQHYLKESDDGTKGWKNKSTPDGTRRTVRNIAGYQLYWYGLGALENYLEEGKISKMTPMVINLLRTAIVPNIIAGDVVQFIESMEIDDIENTDPTFFTDFSDTWEAPDDRLRPERPSDETGDSRKDRKKPRKPWRAENQPSE
jgi:hypothetical protein